MQQDNYTYHDYFNVDDLLTEEHKIIRESVRDWVKQRMSPVINDYAQRAEFPEWVVKELERNRSLWTKYPCRIWRRRHG